MFTTARVIRVGSLLCMVAAGCGGGSDAPPAPGSDGGNGLPDGPIDSGGGVATDGGDASLDGTTGAGIPDGGDAADAATEAEAAPAAAPIAVPLTAIPGALRYTAPVTIGSQSFQLDLSTGTAGLAVAGEGCTTCTGITPLYAPGAHAVDQHQTVATQFQDGSGFSGEIFEDTVTLGGLTPGVSLDFGSIQRNVQQYLSSAVASQGVLGLGPSDLLEPGTTSFLDQLNAVRAEPDVFSIRLCDSTGTLWLGGYDPAAARGAVVYTPAVPLDADDPFYEVTLTSVSVGSVGDAGGGVTLPIGETATIDTRTSLLFLPSAEYTAFFSHVQSLLPGITANACGPLTQEQLDALPPLTLTFPALSGSGTIAVSAPAIASYVFDEGGGSYCLGVADGGTAAPYIGVSFLRSQLTVVDRGAHQVGFAPQQGCP
jgi:hypothetical protein